MFRPPEGAVDADQIKEMRDGEREILIDNLLVRIHLIIEMILGFRV